MGLNILEFFDKLCMIYHERLNNESRQYKLGFSDCIYLFDKYIKQEGNVNLILENKLLKKEISKLNKKILNQTTEINRLSNEKATKII
jgi:hypothetical protein